MAIWFKAYTIEQVMQIGRNTMLDHLQIEITEIGENHISATMPVTAGHVQPMRLLHGGASATLAETLGSLASFMVIDPQKQACVGLELNINHIRAVKEGAGPVTGKATPIHIGRTTHVWNIELTSPENKLVAVSRLTVAILEQKAP